MLTRQLSRVKGTREWGWILGDDLTNLLHMAEEH